MRLFQLLLVLLFFYGSSFFLSAQENGVEAEEFIRILPKSPEEECQHLHVKKGFRMELVASEPQVEDPVAMCFDEYGNLYVAELHDHQHLPDPHTSRVKLLSDRDGDGMFETSKVFADKLGWITGIACWNGGVYVGCSPDLIYLKDTNGDSRADLREVVLSGFDETPEGARMKNYHHERSLNNFNWGPNNLLYGAGGMNGGNVRNLVYPDLAPVVLRKLDFSFDPITRRMRPETGSSQHGMAIDDWGNRFQTMNSNPAMFPSYLLRYRLRNPNALLPTPMASISRPDPKGPVFRRSSPEPWREARTRLRAAGIEKGPVEKGGTVSGYFTGTADGAIYLGRAYPDEYAGSLFVGEVSENVIHRKEIHFPADRVEPDALRPEEESDFEFVASSDNWFRPVQIINGPGGALYVADMYREVVEAWHTIPDYIRDHLDRDAGKDRGRIWKLVPEEYESNQSVPAIADLNSVGLVDVLVSSHGWEQATAARVLLQRLDQSVVPFLREKLEPGTVIEPAAVLRVWYALRSLGALRTEDLLVGLKAENPWVRIHALRILEEGSGDGSAFDLTPMLSLVNDSDPRVVYQLAFTLGEFSASETADAYSHLARRFPEDEWIAKAIAASAGPKNLGRLLSELLLERREASAIVEAVCREAGRLEISLPEGYPAFDSVATETWIAALSAYNDGLKAVEKSLTKAQGSPLRDALTSECLETLQDPSTSLDLKAECLRFLPVLGVPEAKWVETLIPFLVSGSPEELQVTAVDLLRRSGRRSETAEILLSRFQVVEAQLKTSLIQVMAQRAAWRKPLLKAIRDDEHIHAIEVSAAAAEQLRRDPELKDEATALLPVPPDRDNVVASFQLALAMKGDSSRGEVLFRGRCLVCHRLKTEGGEVGPAMGEFQKHGKGQIMLNLLNPNKTVQPDYIGFVVTLKSGEAIHGRVLEDTSASVLMRDAGGNERRIVRDEIESLVSTSRSMMPEGLEAAMKPQDMADLLEFIAGFQ